MVGAIDKHGKAPRRRGRKGNENEFQKDSSFTSTDNNVDVLSYKPHKTLLIHLTESTPTWYECGRGSSGRDDTIHSARNSKGKKVKPRSNPPALVAKYRNLADSIYQQEVTIFRNNASSKDEAWVENTMKRGTLKDRIAAMSVVVSSSPVHKLYALDMLLNLAGVSTVDGGHASQTNERVANMGAEALSDLFSSTLLPKQRKLVGLESRPLYQYEDTQDSNQTKKTISPRILLLWRYEEIMRNKYAAFLTQYLGKTLCQTSTSAESLSKVNALRTACQLLKEIPEGEQMLLSLVVNKVGDPTKKIASAAGHELRKMLDVHPNMTATIAREVQQLAHRPNLSSKALYNCIIFLNQLKLVKEDAAETKSDAVDSEEKGKKNEVSLPASLINTYFQIFEFAVNKGKKTGGKGKGKTSAEMDQAMKSRLLGALLTGVNRAHPYLPANDTGMDQHIDSLYRISHVAPPSASTQALMLLFHLAVGSNDGEESDEKEKEKNADTKTDKMRQDRFYRALYSKVADPTMLFGRQLTLYFNLLYKAMKYDTNSNRVVAFGKRLLHTAFHFNPAVTSGALFLVSEVMKLHPGLSSSALTTEGHMMKFDASKREPSSAFITAVHEEKTGNDEKVKASSGTEENASMWELSLTLHHYHPSVCKFSTDLGAIEYNGDPLRDFTLAPFLDKFAFRNPKSIQKIKNKFRRGESVGERRSGLQAGWKAAKALPVNDPEYWTKQRHVSDQDIFFQKFFTERAKRDDIKGIVRGKKDDEDDALDTAEGKEIKFDWASDDEEEKFVQGLAEGLMKSSGERIEYDDEDPDMDDWSDQGASDVDEDAEDPEGEKPLFETMDGVLTMDTNDDSNGEDAESESDDDLGMTFTEDIDIKDEESEDEDESKKEKAIPESSFAESSEYDEVISKAWEERRDRKRSASQDDDELGENVDSAPKESKKKRKRSKKKKKA